MNTTGLICRASNGFWSAMNARRHRRFLRSLGRVEERQREYLITTLRANRDTAFGRRRDFTSIKSAEQFQRTVPISRYEDYQSDIASILRGEQRVLTRDPVKLLQPTSGSTSACKLIPYTQTLREEFQRGIAPWIVSLFRRRPELMRGRAYWSVSPGVTRNSEGAVPIGFDDDAEYLGIVGRWLFGGISAVPPEVIRLKDVDVFRRRTLAHLLSAEDLTMISVWSPTFLTVLLDALVANPEAVWNELIQGRITLAKPRRQELERLLRGHLAEEGVLQRFWPNLTMISCWTDGPSATYAKALRRYFPDVGIQGKGLIATEAFVSLPLQPGTDPVLAVDSHFFEFRDAENDEIMLAHQLRCGRVYSVIVTTGGGLCRYCLGDRVEVTGRIGQAPTMRFIGREGVASDLMGEKLNGVHVGQCLEHAFLAVGVAPTFFLLAPVCDAEVAGNGGATGYGLFVASKPLGGDQCSALLTNVETHLRENSQYDYCRSLGQLEPVRLFQIDGTRCRPEAVFLEEMQRRGQRMGDVKASALDRETGWEQRFDGTFVDARPGAGESDRCEASQAGTVCEGAG